MLNHFMPGCLSYSVAVFRKSKVTIGSVLTGGAQVKNPLIFASTGEQGDVEGHYKPILGEWGARL